MIDEFFPKQTILLVLFNLLFLLSILFYLSPAYGLRKKVPIGIPLLGIFVFCIFSFWGADWFGYAESYKHIKMGYRTNLEPVYQWIVIELISSYFQFRVIIWGTALVFFYDTIRRLPVRTDLTLFFFVAIWMIWFSYARVSLAMALMFWGTSLISTQERWNFLHSIIGVTAICVSFFFHKSALFGVSAILFALVTRTQKKQLLWVLILMFPLMVYFAQDFLRDFMMEDFAYDESDVDAYMAAGQHSMANEVHFSGWGTIIQRTLERIPFYLLAWACYKLHADNKFNYLPSSIKVFSKILFFIVLVSTIFIFDFEINLKTVYTRFLRFGAIPATIILSYLWENDCYPKLMRYVFIFGFIGVIYSLIYTMYNLSV